MTSLTKNYHFTEDCDLLPEISNFNHDSKMCFLSSNNQVSTCSLKQMIEKRISRTESIPRIVCQILKCYRPRISRTESIPRIVSDFKMLQTENFQDRINPKDCLSDFKMLQQQKECLVVVKGLIESYSILIHFTSRV